MKSYRSRGFATVRSPHYGEVEREPLRANFDTCLGRSIVGHILNFNSHPDVGLLLRQVGSASVMRLACSPAPLMMSSVIHRSHLEEIRRYGVPGLQGR